MNRLLDVYLPAIMASIGEGAGRDAVSQEALGDLQDLLVRQGLDDTEGAGTLGGLLSKQAMK